jgi:hypothetical protein
LYQAAVALHSLCCGSLVGYWSLPL